MPADLHHEIAGDERAPVLLLGCSLGTSVAMWEPQVAPLAERLRVIRYDHRGHGASPVPPGPYDIEDLGRDVLALMDRLGVERASLGGVSLGGMVAMWLGANAPDRVERLVLCCTSAHMPPASAWAERAAKVRAAGTTEVVADAVVERWLTPAFARRESRDAGVAAGDAGRATTPAATRRAAARSSAWTSATRCPRSRRRRSS